MLKPRITCAVDDGLKLIIVRCIGHIDGAEAAAVVGDHLTAVENAWAHDVLIDLSRYHGFMSSDDVHALTHRWGVFAAGRDAGRATVVISHDPLLAARRSATQILLPGRELVVLSHVHEGRAWLELRRETARLTTV